MTCIIIALKHDLHADAVVNNLHSSKQFIRINPLQEISKIYLSSANSDQFSINDTAIKFSKVTGIYCRIALEAIDFSIYSDPIEKYSRQEYIDSLAGILLNVPQHLWMNFPWHEGRASGKIYPLLVATQCGIKVPHFITTNKLWEIKKELPLHKNWIIKPLSDSSIALQDQSFVSTPDFREFSAPYTSEFDLSKINEKDIDETPFLIQEKISKTADIRVVIVDKKVFATISMFDGNDPVDRRLRKIQHEEPYQFDINFQEILVEFVSTLNLRFASLDFLVDLSGNYWLVDINPCGNWLWQEKCEGINISSEIANSLV